MLAPGMVIIVRGPLFLGPGRIGLAQARPRGMLFV